MSCISFLNTCPASGDTEQQLLSKILQVINTTGGGIAGVSSISINGGAPQTGAVSITTGGTVTSVNGDPGPAVSLDSGEIPEGANLYFTAARVRATDLTGFASALGAITAADTILSAFGKTQGRLAALEGGTAGPFLLRAGDTGTGAFLFTPSAVDVVPLTLTTAVGSATTSSAFLVNAGATNRLTIRNDGRFILAGRILATNTDVLGNAFNFSDAGTNNAPLLAAFTHTSTNGLGTAAVGFGAMLDFNLDSTTTLATRATRQTVAWTDATHATRSASTTFFAFTGGVETTQLTLTNNQVQGGDGTAALPTFTSRNDTNTGFFFSAADTLAITLGAAQTGTFSTTVGAFAYGANDTTPYTVRFDKARTSIVSPSVITVGDCLGQVLFRGYSGAGGYVSSAAIRADSTGTIATTRVASSLIFSTATDAAPSVLTDALCIDASQQVGIGTLTPAGIFHIASNTTAQIAYFQQASADTSAATFRFRKNRGTVASPSAITAGDTLGTINFAGYGGASGFITAASIRCDNTGTVADTRVASSIVFATATDATPSVLTDALTLNNLQQVGVIAGSASTPSVVRNVDTDTGFYFPATNTVGLAAGGVGAFQLDSTTQALYYGAADTSGISLSLRKSRGTVASPTVITTGDTLGTVSFRGYDGANYITNGGASIRVVSSGTVASTRIAASLVFATGTDAAPSVLTDALEITSTQRLVISSDGSTASPAIQFSGAATTGLIRPAGATIAIVANGAEALRIGGSSVRLFNSETFGWTSGAAGGTFDTSLAREAAATLVLNNLTTTAATFRITETTDTVASPTNYSRLTFQTAAGNHTIQTQAAGTGTLRTLQVGTGPATGTNIAGTSTIIHGGQGTGTGAGGTILLQVASAGGSGSSNNGLTTAVTVNSSLTVSFASSVLIGATAFIGFTGRSFISSSADGLLSLTNAAVTDFTRLNFGGATNSFNAIGRDAVNGFTLQSAAGTATWNDASTAVSGTVADRYLFGLAAPTLTSTNATVTYTRAASVYIGGAPTASTNVTIGTPYALFVDANNVRFDGMLHFTGSTSSQPALKASSAELQVRLADDSTFASLQCGQLSIVDFNVVLGTSTGTKIGTATSQKLSVWNATPIIQPTTGVAAASFTANAGTAVNDASTFDGYTIGQVVKALRNIGLLA